MKKLSIMVILSLLLLLPAGCATVKNQDSTPLKKVSVLLDWTTNTNHTGVYAAKALGYYEEQGLEVDIAQPGTGGTPQLIAAGKGDFAFSYQEEATIARTKGLPVVAIAAVIQHNTSGFASPVEKGIKTPGDFEGQTYGGWGTPAEEAMLKALMHQSEADFNKVEMVNIGDADFFTSVKRDVDFTWIYWGWTGIESELRKIPLDFIRLRDYHESLDFYSPILITSEETIKNKPELVSKFMMATAKGYEYSIQNPQKAAQILLDNVPELDRNLVLASQEYLAQEYQSDASQWGQMSEQRWKKYADWMYTQKLIEKPLDYEKAFTNQFLPKE